MQFISRLPSHVSHLPLAVTGFEPVVQPGEGCVLGPETKPPDFRFEMGEGRWEISCGEIATDIGWNPSCSLSQFSHLTSPISIQQAGRDSNPQPLVLETSALPIELPTYVRFSGVTDGN